MRQPIVAFKFNHIHTRYDELDYSYDTWGASYKFNGKELDQETGLYYYGARYYTAMENIWLSVDPMSDKYPSMSAYMYCAGNPVILVDPDGRDIDVANESSGNWLKSIVSSKYQDRVIIKNGKVTINTVGLSKKEIESDKGFDLLSKMDQAKEKYLFEVGDIAYMKNEKGENQGFLISRFDESGVMNASDNGKDSEGAYTNLPSTGYNGQVSMSESGNWLDANGNDSKKSIIFHELAENYYRTTFGYDYHGNKSNGGFGAHYRAGRLESNSFGNPQPGSSKFNKPSFNNVDRYMQNYIINR